MMNKHLILCSEFEEAINLLKSVLLKNEFNFYFHKDGKLYKKNAEGIKRVKDIRELLNG